MAKKTAAQRAAEREAEAARNAPPVMFAIEADLAQGILNFLLTCEAGKVLPLIDGLRQLKTVEIQEEEEKSE